MLGMPSFDLTDERSKQDFIKYIIGLVRKEIISYTPSFNVTDNLVASGLAAGGDLTGVYPNPSLITVGTSGAYTKVSTDTKGRVISGTTLVAADIPTLTLAKISDAGTAAAKNIPATGNASATEIVYGSDTRLTNARTPTTHAATHIPGGTDALDYSKIVGYGTALPTFSASLHPAGVLWAVNTVGEPYALYRSNGSAFLKVGGGGSITVSDTAPTASAGSLWFNSSNGKTYIYYADANSTQWVEIGENAQVTIPGHASTHIRGGSDIIDGDRVTVDYVPTNYTRNAAASGAGDVTDLTAHLAGIDMILPAGILMPYAGSTEPSGWVFCYGQTIDSVANTLYARLFTAIGTTYGGSSASSFILPDLRGRMPAGKDNMGGTAASRITAAVSVITGTTLGATGGSEALHTHTHTQNAHLHRVYTSNRLDPNAIGFNYNTSDGAGFGTPGGTSGTLGYVTKDRSETGAQLVENTTATNQNTGTGSSQNMPPTIITNYIIKL